MDRPGCLDVVTDADTMGSVQSPALACDQLVASGFCARLALRHSSALFVPCSALCTSAFLPTFPPRGFASRASHGSHHSGTMRALTPAGPSQGRQVSPLTPPAFRVSRPQPHDVPQNVAFPVTSARLVGPRRFLGFAMRSQARQHTLPKRVRYPPGYSFASSCFPPRLAATQ